MKEKGYALVVTLWVLVLLTVIAINFSHSVRVGSAATRNFKDSTRAYYLAVSAYEEALAYLLSDRDPAVDFMDSEGNFRTDAERDSITGTREANVGQVEIRITDEESRLNINYMHAPVLKRLLEYTGVPYEDIQDIADSLLDWRDADDLHHISGAEDEYYEPLGYRPKNDLLDVPEELLLVKGLTPKIYSGEESTRPFSSLITTWGKDINVNTISPELLEVLGFSDVEIDSLIDQRRARNGLRRVPSTFKRIGVTKSNHFRIHVAARLQGDTQVVRITSIVKRFWRHEGPELMTLYWKEDLENSGT